MAGQALYLYCFTRTHSVDAVEGTGVDGRNGLFLRKFGSLAAVLSQVDLEEFVGPQAEARMKDIAYVGPRACSHERVIEHIMGTAAVLPARFGTIFSTGIALERLINTHKDTIGQFLAYVADKQEWSVKGLLDAATLKEVIQAQTFERQKQRLEALSPGKRYFQEKRLQGVVTRELTSWIREKSRAIARQLGNGELDCVARRLLSRETTDSEQQMVLNLAYLIPVRAMDRFHHQVTALNAEPTPYGLVLKTSGPWPPYSFCPPLTSDGHS